VTSPALDGRIPGYLGRVLDRDGVPAGTCFQVAPGVLVTAWHVLDEVGASGDGAQVRVDPLAGGTVFRAEVMRTDPLRDLAVLTCEMSLTGAAAVLAGADSVALRTAVSVTGHAVPDDPGNVYRFLSAPGEWAGGTTRNDAVRLGRMTAPGVVPGMSGAPVIRDDDGAVVGVVSGRYNSVDGWLAGTVWVARAEDMAVLLDGIGSVALPRPLLGAAALLLEVIAAGPAIGLPVTSAGDSLAGAAQRWFRRLRGKDGLSRLVKSAADGAAGLTDAEFGGVQGLLEDQQTWVTLGRATAEKLSVRIAYCLPPRDGRASGDSQAIALVIAQALLEFAAADFDPELFRQLLLARLGRMEAGQASALDKSLLALHADLAFRLTTRGELDAECSATVIRSLRQAIERLPAATAGRGEIVVYLMTLTDWLNTDPWPRDRRFSGPVLTPATIERKLRVTSVSRAGERDLDADTLARQCQRLVVLGGPGSGKTWLAKRMARRCAEDALEALAAGESLDEIELPLFTTCSRLFSASGSIREAAVSSALDQIGDLGGTRLSASLRRFFTERNVQTILVLDSLDEARGSSERLRQADKLPWRVILTSRPSSWNHQFIIEEGDDSHQVGELQPLRYPDDIEPFIARWFAARPDWGRDLLSQIARRPGLQRAATVPLILAFYCIVGGGQPLPEFTRDLHARVIRRMLTGRWRGDHHSSPDVEACMQTLRAWAWSGAMCHPVSGIGTWPDEIPTASCPGQPGDALDHVAMPLGPANLDTGMTPRRFIHRSIREYLVAEHVAGLAVGQAAEALLAHLWYDPDWEYSAPAAIAMHPDHNQLLRDLICRAANSDRIPVDLSAIDAGVEIRGLLARVAAESDEASWSPDLLSVVGQARLHFATSARPEHLVSYDRFGDLDGTVPAPRIMSRQAREDLLGLLASRTSSTEAARLADGVVQLASSVEDKRQTREVLLRLLQSQPIGPRVAALVDAVVRLCPSSSDKRQIREVLLGLLRSRTDSSPAAILADGVAQLEPSPEDRRQACAVLLRLLRGQRYSSPVQELMDAVIRLDPSAEERRQACAVLLGLLHDPPADSGLINAVADGVIRLAPSPKETRQAREIMLDLLANYTHPLTSAALVKGVAQLAPSADDKNQARHTLLKLLASATDSSQVSILVDGIVQLAPGAVGKQHAREVLLGLLQGQPADSLDSPDAARRASDLADGVARLDPSAGDQREARKTLLGLLPSQAGKWTAEKLAHSVAQLDPSAEERQQAREVVLSLLGNHTDYIYASSVIDEIVLLAQSAGDKRQARHVLLRLMISQTTKWMASDLADGVARLDPSAEERMQSREVLFGLLVDPDHYPGADRLVDRIVQLAPSAEEKQQAREALFGLLLRQVTARDASDLADGVARLDPSAEERRQTREVLFRLLGAGHSDPYWDLYLPLRRVGNLGPTAEDTRQARELLLRHLHHETDQALASALVRWITQLEPTARDLSSWHSWTAAPTAELLAAVRRNSELADWLESLPSIAPLAQATGLRYRWRMPRAGKGRRMSRSTLTWGPVHRSTDPA
jgi:hypothetical protein